jgi:hypothetical protein
MQPFFVVIADVVGDLGSGLFERKGRMHSFLMVL